MYLDLHSGEIRLVELLPGQWSEEIRCQLHHAPLANKPVYKALSYAWGNSRTTRPIFVNGNPIYVAVTLEFALRRMRQTENHTYLWVDALSINQSNNAERKHQVSLMRNIFTITEEVLVYLGEEQSLDFSKTSRPKNQPAPTTVFRCDKSDEKSLISFRSHCTLPIPKGALVKGVGFDYDYAHDTFCLLRFLSECMDSQEMPPFDDMSIRNTGDAYHKNLFEALRLLMLSRWWNRIWVIQEIVVPEKATMIYGSARAPWEMFVKASLCYFRNRSSQRIKTMPREYTIVLAFFSQTVLDISTMRERWRKNEQMTLLSLLRQFRNRGATDDRDKVYALLGLAIPHMHITPDYDLDTMSVYQSTMLDIIETTHSLNVLTGDLGRKNRHGLPSWVPDWSAIYDGADSQRDENIKNYNATLGSMVTFAAFKTMEIESESHKHPSQLIIYDGIDLGHIQGSYNNRKREKLGLFGTGVDTVRITGEVMLSEDQLHSVMQSWGILAVTHLQDMVEDLGDMFQRTMCADMIHSDSSAEGLQSCRVANDEKVDIVSWFMYAATSPFPLQAPTDWQEPLLSARDVLFGKLYRPEYNIPTKRERSTEHIRSSIRIATYRRRFFITEKGRLGLGPPDTRVGDEVYLLLGGQSPFILRDTTTRPQSLDSGTRFPEAHNPQYEKIIGDCYVHGIMDGEAMARWMPLRSANTQVPDLWNSELQNFVQYPISNLEAIKKQIPLDIERQWSLDSIKSYRTLYETPHGEVYLEPLRYIYLV